MEQHEVKQILWILGIPAVAIAYYFGVALPANNRERLALEREKFVAEQEHREAAERDRQEGLDSCLDAANEAYWSYVKLNGKELKDGQVEASQHIWSQADKRKNDEREACFKRYPKP